MIFFVPTCDPFSCQENHYGDRAESRIIDPRNCVQFFTLEGNISFIDITKSALFTSTLSSVVALRRHWVQFKLQTNRYFSPPRCQTLLATLPLVTLSKTFISWSFVAIRTIEFSTPVSSFIPSPFHKCRLPILHLLLIKMQYTNYSRALSRHIKNRKLSLRRIYFAAHETIVSPRQHRNFSKTVDCKIIKNKNHHFSGQQQ